MRLCATCSWTSLSESSLIPEPPATPFAVSEVLTSQDPRPYVAQPKSKHLRKLRPYVALRLIRKLKRHRIKGRRLHAPGSLPDIGCCDTGRRAYESTRKPAFEGN